MARILPDGWQSLHLAGGLQREVETLHELETALSDAYTVYHSVHWTRLKNDSSVFGELDFVVVAPSGRVLVIEQKSGVLQETAEGLAKVYAGGTKSVSIQLARSVSALQHRLAMVFGPHGYRVEELLYCPDYNVSRPDIAGVNASRIVDASRRDTLAETIIRILPLEEDKFPCHDRIHDFLADTLSLAPDAGAIAGTASKLVTRVSGGLATWARSIHFHPFRLRVVGTAGSGKTQLAISVLRDASEAGRRALYVCFNRPLADHVRAIAPDDVLAVTFHQLCAAVLSNGGVEVDFRQHDAFERLEHAFSDGQIPESFRFDVIVVDEGQDFLPEWFDSLERLLLPDGAWWWLEDPMQNLYQRPHVDRSGWVELRAMSNYRSPRDIVRFVQRLADAALPVEAAGLFDGTEVGLLSYPEGGVGAATRQALTDAAALGFRQSDIALLTYQGRDKSWLTNLDRLGPYRLRSFTGQYDPAGAPIYREGNLLVDSVFRFKGQCAPCVILTEVDFSEFDENVFRRIFVGATRATMKLIIVASERSAAKLLMRL